MKVLRTNEYNDAIDRLSYYLDVGATTLNIGNKQFLEDVKVLCKLAVLIRRDLAGVYIKRKEVL